MLDERVYQRIYAALLAPFAAPEIDEVLVNGNRGLWQVGSGRAVAGDTPFRSESEVTAWTQELARRHGVRLDPVCGSAGGVLSDHEAHDGKSAGHDHAYRWHCVLPPLSPEGALLSLRRHRFGAVALADFAAVPGALPALREAAIGRMNMVIVGPTGSGKTTLLAALLAEYASQERVILIEALTELPLPSPFSARLVERKANLEQVGAVSLTRLVHEALRLRPDRLVIGEIRGQEAAAFCEALVSGHSGVMTTLHADDPDDALARLTLLARSAGWGQAPIGWKGVPLLLAVLCRGSPPRLREVTARRFVPSG